MNDNTVSQGASAPPATSAVAKAGGDLVAARLPGLRATLNDMVQSGVLHLTLDLADVRLIDSAGIGLLVAAHNSLRKAGGDLSVIHASRDILELFRAMRIHQHFSVSGS